MEYNVTSLPKKQTVTPAPKPTTSYGMSINAPIKASVSTPISSMGARATFPGANNTSTSSTKLSPAQTLPVIAKANTQSKSSASSNMSGDAMKAPTSTAFTSGVAGVPNKPLIKVNPPSTNNVTKHSVTTGADGSTTVTHNYATPKVEGTSSTITPATTETSPTTQPVPVPVPVYGSDVKDAQGNVVGQNKFDPNTGKPLTPPTEEKKPVDTNPPVDNSREGLINKLINRGDVSQQEMDLEAQRAKELAANQEQIAGVGMIGGDQSLATGRAGILQGLSAEKQSAYNTGLANLAAKRQASGAVYGTAIGAKSPIQVSPGTSVVDPNTGKVIYGGANQYKDWSNTQFNTKQAQDEGAKATNVEATANQLTTQATNLNSVMNKYSINKQGAPILNLGYAAYRQQLDTTAQATFDYAFNGLKDTLSQIQSSPDTSIDTKNFVTALLSKFGDSNFPVSAINAEVKQALLKAKADADKHGSQAKTYDQAGTSTVGTNTNINTNPNLSGSNTSSGGGWASIGDKSK